MKRTILSGLFILLFQFISFAQVQVNGLISDEQGQPLPGATILEKNTSNGVVTDFDGNYSIQVSDDNASLIISFVGYKTLEVSVGDLSDFNFNLQPDNELDEVVILPPLTL